MYTNPEIFEKGEYYPLRSLRTRYRGSRGIYPQSRGFKGPGDEGTEVY